MASITLFIRSGVSCPIFRKIIWGLLKTFRQRHCEGNSPKQSIDSLHSGLLHYVRNDEKMELLEVPICLSDTSPFKNLSMLHLLLGSTNLLLIHFRLQNGSMCGHRPIGNTFQPDPPIPVQTQRLIEQHLSTYFLLQMFPFHLNFSIKVHIIFLFQKFYEKLGAFQFVALMKKLVSFWIASFISGSMHRLIMTKLLNNTLSGFLDCFAMLAMTATCIVITLFCRGFFPCPLLAMTSTRIVIARHEAIQDTQVIATN